MNKLDHLLAALGLARRTAKPTQTRMYASARKSRTSGNWITSASTSADAEIATSLAAVRDRSRALVRDSAYAGRAKSLIVNNVIGTGIGIQAQVRNTRKELRAATNDGIEDAWCAWTKARRCHTGGTLTFADFERTVMGEVVEAGEAFVRIHRAPFGDSKIPLALELIEGERVSEQFMPPVDMGQMTNFRMGVEMDAYFRPVAYWVLSRHPGELQNSPRMSMGPYTVTRVPAEDMLHLKIVTRFPQTRGMPWFHAIAKKLNDMDHYSDAEITAARGAASYIGSWEGVGDFDDPNVERQSDGTYETELEPGIILDPEPGRKFVLHSPNRPNSAFDPFMRYMLREFCAGTGVNYASLSMDYSQSNYSSSRLALLDDRDCWKVLQRWFVREFREPIHAEFIRQGTLVGALPITLAEYAADAERFEAVKFKLRGWSWIDPVKEVEAYERAVRDGFTTRTRVVAQTADGADIEEIDEERAQELEDAEALELVYDTDPGVDAKGAPVATSGDDASTQQDTEGTMPPEDMPMSESKGGRGPVVRLGGKRR